ncbi:pilus assembly PilX family protein [Cellvibrio mixtus]|uniref:pilus assembly PilX family protein n=1 Tax=Cellvibrio mixtus TaxID=39650 RepID=UPI000A4A8671|nr:PilX N-terminal domain-containing pilus assembly protein [Cellvibrio mixtus]
MQSQRGMVLIVGLIMVLLMSIIGVAAIRGSNTQEAMAGNMRDRNQAFQATEAALRTAELNVAANGSKMVFENKNGLLTNQNLKDAPFGPVARWAGATWDTNSIAINKSDIDLKLTKMPAYVVEKVEVEGPAAAAMGESTEYGANVEQAGNSVIYRITARGYGGSEKSEVILQSTFRAKH